MYKYFSSNISSKIINERIEIETRESCKKKKRFFRCTKIRQRFVSSWSVKASPDFITVNSAREEQRNVKFDLKRKRRRRRKGENSLRHCPPSFHRSLFIYFFFLIQAVACVSVNRARREQGLGRDSMEGNQFWRLAICFSAAAIASG